MPQKSYRGDTQTTKLTQTLRFDETASFFVEDGTALPTNTSFPFVLIVSRGTAREEKILCTSVFGNEVYVAPEGRGFDDTVPVRHPPGSSVLHGFDSESATEFSNHVYSETNAHGVDDFSELITQAQLTDHNDSTQNVHGIGDTADIIQEGDYRLLDTPQNANGPLGVLIARIEVRDSNNNLIGYLPVYDDIALGGATP